MKVVTRSIGSFLIAALAVALVISMVCFTLIPKLSQYISNTFPSERNLEFVSTTAPDPDPSHATPVDGDIYEDADYTYSYSAALGGWKLTVKDKTKSQYSLLCNTIYGLPVVDIGEAFKDCSQLTQAPAIPAGVKNMQSAFAGCTSLTGTMAVYANPEQFDNCFNGTVAAISLIGSSTSLTELAETSPSANITVK